MNHIVKRALLGVLVGGGLALLGTAAAQAAETSGDDGTASGTQALLGVSLPVTLGGNGISVLGDSSSSGAAVPAPAPAAAPAAPPAPAASTGGSGGVASGTQALISLAAPITVGGNGISVLGDSSSTGAGGGTAPAPVAGTGDAPTTAGTGGTASGSQVVAPVQAPVTVGGNAISVLGDSSSTGGTGGTAAGPATGGQDAGGATTDGTGGTASGTQLAAPIALPITVGGNAVSVIGDSGTDVPVPEVPGTPTDPGTPADPGTPGDDTPAAPPAAGIGVPAAVGAVGAVTALAVTGGELPASVIAWALGLVAAGLAGLAVRLLTLRDGPQG